MALTYLDFEVEIGPSAGRDYPIAVLHSPAGEARTMAIWSLSELQLENRLKDLQIALLSSGGVRRQILSHAEQAVQAFGRELFEWLFTGEVRNRYDVSQESARQQGKGLRVKLRIQPPALAALPWEYLYDPRTAEYLCLSRTTPVVRYLELPQTIQPLAVTPPLQVLGMIASPTDLQPLDINLEKTRIARAIADLEAQGLVQWTWLPGQTWRDLQRALRRGPWHIFHFIGHGMFDSARDEGIVALADAEGKAHLLSASELGRLLADHQTLRLALLNSCESAQSSARDIFAGTAATLIRRGLPAVVAMQYAITDRAAIEFAQTFYESLADGLAIDAAVGEARKAISVGITNSLEWGTPVLYLRAPDGQLFAPGQLKSKDEHSTPSSGNQPMLDDPRWANVLQIRTTSERWGKPDNKPALDTIVYPETTIPFDWVTIPAGEFLMGSNKAKDKDAYDNELPQHKLYLPEYQIARVPVTNEQYKQFVAATKYQAPKHWQNGQIPKGKEKHPVVKVSWHDAIAFCEWAKVRLPTEAEWEKAARGIDGRIYPWGNDNPGKSRCNFNRDVGDTTPVGNYPKGASFYVPLSSEPMGAAWVERKVEGHEGG